MSISFFSYQVWNLLSVSPHFVGLNLGCTRSNTHYSNGENSRATDSCGTRRARVACSTWPHQGTSPLGHRPPCGCTRMPRPRNYNRSYGNQGSLSPPKRDCHHRPGSCYARSPANRDTPSRLRSLHLRDTTLTHSQQPCYRNAPVS